MKGEDKGTKGDKAAATRPGEPVYSLRIKNVYSRLFEELCQQEKQQSKLTFEEFGPKKSNPGQWTNVSVCLISWAGNKDIHSMMRVRDHHAVTAEVKKGSDIGLTCV